MYNGSSNIFAGNTDRSRAKIRLNDQISTTQTPRQSQHRIITIQKSELIPFLRQRVSHLPLTHARATLPLTNRIAPIAPRTSTPTLRLPAPLLLSTNNQLSPRFPSQPPFLIRPRALISPRPTSPLIISKNHQVSPPTQHPFLIRSRSESSTTQTSTASSGHRFSNVQHHQIPTCLTPNPILQSVHRNDTVGNVNSSNPPQKRLLHKDDLENLPIVKKLKEKITLQEQQLKIARRTSNRRKHHLILKKQENNVLKAKMAVMTSHKEKFRIIADMIGPAGVGFHSLIRRMVKLHANDGRLPRIKCSPEMRTFAMTMYYHSVKGYKFIRRICNKALPHTRTIQKWLASIDGRPGFSGEAFAILARRLKDNDGVRVPCCLIFDEMSIKEQKCFDGARIYGYVDTGIEVIDENSILAKHVLVFLVAPMNKSWKVPIGHFFVTGLTAKNLKYLVLQGLERCAEAGFDIHNLIFDGASTNFSICTALDCDFTLSPPKTHFPHPTSNHQVNVMPDPMHMLKVVRNCFGQWLWIVDGDQEKIKFDYIRQLYLLQKQGELKVAPKLTLAHIDFDKKIMRVKLAVQVLSR